MKDLVFLQVVHAVDDLHDEPLDFVFRERISPRVEKPIQFALFAKLEDEIDFLIVFEIREHAQDVRIHQFRVNFHLKGQTRRRRFKLLMWNQR